MYIPNYENLYSITPDGEVYSWVSKKSLKPSIDRSTGYRAVSLHKNKKSKTFIIARLVALTYLKKPLKKRSQVNHKNGIKTDDRVENLEWCTAKENQRHAFATGLNKGKKGEKNVRARLTNEKVKTIRELYKQGEFQINLAKKFKVCQTSISAIVRRQTWRHI